MTATLAEPTVSEAAAETPKRARKAPAAKKTTSAKAVSKKPAAKKTAAKKTTKKVAAKKTTAKKTASKAAPSEAPAAKKAPARKKAAAKKTAAKKGGLSILFLAKEEYNACIDGMMAQGLDREDAIETLKVGIRQANGRPVPPDLLRTHEAPAAVM